MKELQYHRRIRWPLLVNYSVQRRMERSALGIIPVSYTHLDVYKRQGYQNAAGVQSVLSNTFMAGNYTDTDGAVRSYADTFVEDVYKRQVYLCTCHQCSKCRSMTIRMVNRRKYEYTVFSC